MPMRYALTMLMNKYVPDNDVAIKLTHRCLMNELLSHKRFNTNLCVARMGNQEEWWEHPLYSMSSYYWDSGIQTRSSISGIIYSCDMSLDRTTVNSNKWVSRQDCENYTNLRYNLIHTINRDTDKENYDFNHQRYYFACNYCQYHLGYITNFLKIGLRGWYDNQASQLEMMDKLAITPELLRRISRPHLLKYCS